MLMPSPRHTDADLALWAEYEAADLAHAKELCVKVDKSIDAIKHFAEHGSFYCAASGGKDSMVIADLMMRSHPAPLVYAKAIPTANPDCAAVFDAFKEVWPSADIHTVQVDYRPNRNLPIAEKLQLGTRAFLNAFKQFGSRRVTGIRQEESSSRRISAAVHGESTANVCRPILRWSTTDVFAYLAVRKLPVHPAYAMLGGGRWDRNRLRVDELAGMTGDGMGRALWEREYYADILAQMNQSEGELR